MSQDWVSKPSMDMKPETLIIPFVVAMFLLAFVATRSSAKYLIFTQLKLALKDIRLTFTFRTNSAK